MLRKIQLKKIDSLLPKPAETLFLISTGLWAEISVPQAPQIFSRLGKRVANIIYHLSEVLFPNSYPAWCVLLSLQFPY